jgi:hypothetical protein
MEKAKPPLLPRTIVINGRIYVTRGDAEKHKADVVATALGVAAKPITLTESEASSLIPIKVLAAELGIGRRQIGRRLLESQKASQAA